MNKNKIQYSELYEDLSRVNLASFATYCIKDYEVTWFNKIMCRKIQNMLNGSGKKKVMIFMPPQHGKSTIVSKALPAFAFGQDPDLQVANASYASSLAENMNRSVQRLMMSNEYKTLFPGVQLGGKGFSQNTRIFEITGRKGRLKSIGVAGGLTGFTVDLGIIDDPVRDMQEVSSEKLRDKTWEWYNSVWTTRMGKKSKELFTMTRWHEDDLAGRILNSNYANEWDVLVLPFIKEEISTCNEDHRTVGEALWESHHPIEEALKQKEDSERRYNALLQQHPSSSEGNIIKEYWLRYYDYLPGNITRVIHSWDLGFKNTGHSYVVGTVWGIVNNTYAYLIAMNRDHYDFVETVKQIKRTLEIFPSNEILIEDKANGTAVMSQLKSQVPGIIAINPTESKESRLYAASFLFESGNVFFPSNQPWVEDVKSELINFPLGKNDDIVDTISQVIKHVFINKQCKLFKMGIQ